MLDFTRKEKNLAYLLRHDYKNYPFDIHAWRDLTSSLRHPKIFVKEFFDGFVTFHDHCSGEELSIERESDLYGSHCFGHSQHFVYA